MIIYKDKLAGDELFTDAFKVKEDQECFVFTGKQVTRKDKDIDDSMFGGNASAEEVQEQMESCETSGLDFAMNCRLQQGYMNTKKEYQAYFKKYVQELQNKLFPESEGVKKEDLPPEVKEYHQRAKAFFERIMGMHKDVVPYFGETDEEYKGSCCFAKYLEDGMTVEVYAFKDGVSCEKC